VRDRLDAGATDETTLLVFAAAQTSGGRLFGAGIAVATSGTGRIRLQ
jgi:hypothetical protein